MKYLSDYTQDAQTAMFNKYGVIFAFSNEQLKKGFDKVKEQGILLEGEKFCSMGHGMYCPTKNADKVINELSEISKAGIAQDLEENGINSIVLRELYNHEAFYTGDSEDTFEAVARYGVTREQVERKLRNKNYNIELV